MYGRNTGIQGHRSMNLETIGAERGTSGALHDADMPRFSVTQETGW